MSDWFENYIDQRARDFEARRLRLEESRRAKFLQFEQRRREKAEQIERDFYERMRRAQTLLAAVLTEQATVEITPPQVPPTRSSPSIEANGAVSAPPPPAIQARTVKGIQPQLLWCLFRACHGLASMFCTFQEGKRGGLRFIHGVNRLSLFHADLVPLELRNIDQLDKTAIDDWVRQGTQNQLERLDSTTWDVAIWLLVMFFAHGDNQDAGHEFEAWITHYFDWRGVGAGNRTASHRQEVAERVLVLAGLHVQTDAELRQRDGSGGRRQKMPVFKNGGPFLAKAVPFGPSAEAREVAGFRIMLGEWARPYIEETAMLGVYHRRLSEYDHRRAAWERQIGWYLVSQMQAQGSRMKFQTVKGHTQVTPQQPLRMKSILDGAIPSWIGMAKNDPGKVIRQFEAALETLKNDSVIGDYKCLDDPADGADLPRRGRLQMMLNWRYMIYPGPDMVEHLRAKQTAASQAKAEAAQRRTAGAKADG